MKHDLVIGIDPGLAGGIAWTTLQNDITYATPMPVLKTKVHGKSKHVLDEENLACLLRNLDREYAIQLCCVENVHAMPKQGVTSMFTFGQGFGTIRGIIAALQLPRGFVQPPMWKKDILIGTKRDKDAAVKFCQKHFPTVSLIPKGHRTPHDGLADALCITEFARRKTLEG